MLTNPDESSNKTSMYIQFDPEAQCACGTENIMVQCVAKNSPLLSVMGSLYVTSGAVGFLVGVFVAGMLVALEEARLSGHGRVFSDFELTVVGLGTLAGGTTLGVFVAGLFRALTWARRRISNL